MEPFLRLIKLGHSVKQLYLNPSGQSYICFSVSYFAHSILDGLLSTGVTVIPYVILTNTEVIKAQCQNTLRF